MSRPSDDVPPFEPRGSGIDGATLADLAAVIESAWAAGPNAKHSPALREVVAFVIDALDAGRLRVAERQGVGRWTVNHWVKQAVLLSFRLNDSRLLQVGGMSYFDKVDSKFAGFDEPELRASGVRTVPPAMVRHGAYLARDVVVMPSFINIGAYVDQGTMVDGWANVGSCAQIGKRVHLSAAAQVGGVLEPINAAPVIIEDDVLVGGNCGIFEGTLVRARAVLGAGTILTRSTPLYDLVKGEVYGASADAPLEVPENAVVVPGSRAVTKGKAAEWNLSLYTPVIVKYPDEKTDRGIELEEWLR